MSPVKLMFPTFCSRLSTRTPRLCNSSANSCANLWIAACCSPFIRSCWFNAFATICAISKRVILLFPWNVPSGYPFTTPCDANCATAWYAQSCGVTSVNGFAPSTVVIPNIVVTANAAIDFFIIILHF